MAEISQNIQIAQEHLEKGELVGVPTETVYGLAGNALNADTVVKIFEVKQRPSFDPLIVHVANMGQLESFVKEIPEAALKLANRFWPGPLTLLLPKKTIIPDIVTSGLETVAVRIPNNQLTLALLRNLDFPLAAPSANPFGYISPTSAQHVNAQLGDKIPFVLDGSACEVGIESTIVGFESEKPIIYRLGGLSLNEIEAVIGNVEVKPHSTSNPKAPGMLKSHYAPKKPIHQMEKQHISTLKDKTVIGWLGFNKFLDDVPKVNQRLLSPAGNLSEAARNLFSHLRELDEMNIQMIYTELVPKQGLGLAINDRLKRAIVKE